MIENNASSDKDAELADLNRAGVDIATTKPGTPGGIWTVESSASNPPSGEESIGTPITGTMVCAATTPARCAAAPAPTTKT